MCTCTYMYKFCYRIANIFFKTLVCAVACVPINIFSPVLGHQLYWFNSRPNSPGSNYGRCVDILAPGQWIRSASHM